jgi:hypothetical protein
MLHVGGWAGVVMAGVAWYTSAAGVVNGMSPRPVLPVGSPLWGPIPVRTTPPCPRSGGSTPVVALACRRRVVASSTCAISKP